MLSVQHKPVESDGLFASHDRNLIVILLMFGYEIVKTERANGIVTFFFNSEEIKPTMDLWKSNSPIPSEDVRGMFPANVTFNSFIRGDF